MPEIIEFYGDYEPPFDVGRIVEKLLSLVPAKALVGLKSIVLTTSSQLPSRERRRKIRSRGITFKGGEALGCYRSPRQGVPASVELYVDNMMKRCPEERLREKDMRELLVGSTLFHEIGHHVHEFHEPRHVHPEIVAEDWEARLLKKIGTDSPQPTG